jgi:hypothetical protein
MPDALRMSSGIGYRYGTGSGYAKKIKAFEPQMVRYSLHVQNICVQRKISDGTL